MPSYNTLSGLDQLINNKELQSKVKGNVGYLCHSASVDKDLNHGLAQIKNIFNDRLKKVFAPQHGLVSNVQDNMIETDHYLHPYFNLKIYSLYSETRVPTDEMLEGLDSILVDLQDVGTRIYTYIYTLTLLMQACSKKDIKIYVLDRPNPIGGLAIEGNILDDKYASFVGRHPIPTRHGLTIGEVALMANKFWQGPCELEVIKMKNWKRSMFFEETKLPWVLPSPNLSTVDGCFTFVGTVLFEGTNISEGRGTTRALEMVGHPSIEPFEAAEEIKRILAGTELTGFKLRPIVFLPTFQKHANISCGGFQIHPTNRETFRPWALSQILCQYFYHKLKDEFQWKLPPYEYEYYKQPIDLINGTPLIRQWIENNGSLEQLKTIEQANRSNYLSQREDCLIY
jgi:uncharacterized protein YbbC (DUF1343 family)